MCEQAQLLVDARVETVVGGWVKIIDGAFVVSRFFSLQKQYMVISFRKNLKIHFVEPKITSMHALNFSKL